MKDYVLTEFEKLRTRIILAQSVGISPDSVKVINNEDNDNIIYVLDNFNGYNLVLGFCEVPTKEIARECVKELYLSGVEIDFDEEFVEK